MGKTNMDQFATGLTGTRSPFGPCLNSINPEYISGGSSSGSAVAVAMGSASFALGTDTAGSGRVPAAFNGLVGHKPTRGWIPTSGVVPACRSLDTISIFSLNAGDACVVLAAMVGTDPEDPYSRPVKGHGFDFGSVTRFSLGIPRDKDLKFFGNAETEALYAKAVEHAKYLGAECVEVNLSPFLEAAKLLYDGPWVAERYAAIKNFFDSNESCLMSVTRSIIGSGKHWSAADAFLCQYRLAVLQAQCNVVWGMVDVIMVPTAGTIYKIDEVEKDPIILNSNLGYYTNFINLLDYCAIAVPFGKQGNEIPFGVTFFAPAHQDLPLLHLASKWLGGEEMRATTENHRRPDAMAALPNGQFQIAVCGAHMSDLPLNWQLTSRGGRLVRTTMTSQEYRLFALPGGDIHRPGLVHVEQGGTNIAVEIWELPDTELGSFMEQVPFPLAIGTIKLVDGSTVKGFLCDYVATSEAEDISRFTSWRSYVDSLKEQQLSSPLRP